MNVLNIRANHIQRTIRWSSQMRQIDRKSLSNDQIREHRLRIFEREKQNQMSKIRRLEKIEVNVQHENQSTKLTMNKYLSSPLDCAKHLSSFLVDRSCLALVNDQHIWDINQPLQEDCSLKFLHFLDENVHEQNRAYWRTCSFILGYLLETSFKSDYLIELCSFPSPDFQYGSFVYDAKLNLGQWKATNDDLRCLSTQAYKLRDLDLRFERLEISQAVAEEMFAFDRFKLLQIPQIARLQSNDDHQPRLVVYRMGNAHVDITKGPLISSTKQIGRFEFASIHDIDLPSYGEQIQRIQALSIPNQLHLHYWTFNYLLERAKKFNRSSIPTLNRTSKETNL